jgi:glycosyltransferase involved in cell wall biosynthesis
MKISFLLPAIFKSGGIKIIFEFANRLADKGHNVVLYYPRIPYNFYPDVKNPVYNIKRYIKGILNYLPVADNSGENKFEIASVSRLNNHSIMDADVVIATAWPTAYSLNKLNESKGQKVYFIQGYEVWGPNEKAVNNSYLLLNYKITISVKLHDLLKNKFNVESVIIPNSIDFIKFNNLNKVYNELPVISFIYNNSFQKNMNGAISVLTKIKNEFGNVKIKCVGLKNQKSIPPFIDFVENPSESEIVRFYCESDIFLFSSLMEGFALPPAEAMACKCAVVTNDVGAVSQYSTDKVSAIHCNPENPDELYEGIKYLLNNKDEMVKISENGYNIVRNTLSWKNSFKLFEEYLYKLVNNY